MNNRVRADVFVRDHFETLKGQMLLSVAKYTKSQELQKLSQNTHENSPINVVRSDCHKSNTVSQSQTKHNKNRSQSSILNPLNSQRFIKSVPVLRNGSHTLLDNRKLVELNNTCSFDSIISIYACLYFEYQELRDYIDKNYSSDFSNLIQLLYQQNSFDQAAETVRYKMLKKIFARTQSLVESNTFIHINAKASISHMISRICSNKNELVASKEETVNCLSCGQKKTTFCSHLNVDLNIYDLCDVQNSIEENGERTCRNCSNVIHSTKIQNTFTSVVAIDTKEIDSGVHHRRYAINNISKYINLNGTEYELIGAIEHQPISEHFVAHIKRASNEWFTFDNMVGRTFECDVGIEIIIHMIFYKKTEISKYFLALIY